ncbi:frigida-LIKE protein, partial [Trifolium pratense]
RESIIQITTGSRELDKILEVKSYMDNELSPTIDDGTSLQLLPTEETDILANLRESSDPVEDALKLTLDLKANMKENTENSLMVLGFLMLLSIYGLVTYFNEDEVCLELFAFVAQHKIAVKLFEALGFANKLSEIDRMLFASYVENVES